MNALESLPMGLVRDMPPEPLSGADQYQLDAIAAAQSDAMDPDNEPAQDLG